MKTPNSILGEGLTIDDSKIETIFSKLHLNDDSPMKITGRPNKVNWIVFLDYYKAETHAFIQKIYVKMPYLDSELVSLLSKLEECSYFRIVDTLKHEKLRNTDLAFLTIPFCGYRALCKELEAYYQKNLA